jgi:hypothetical protein
MSTVYLNLLEDGVSISDGNDESMTLLAKAEANSLLAAAETLVHCSNGGRSIEILVRNPDRAVIARLRLTSEVIS